MNRPPSVVIREVDIAEFHKPGMPAFTPPDGYEWFSTDYHKPTGFHTLTFHIKQTNKP